MSLDDAAYNDCAILYDRIFLLWSYKKCNGHTDCPSLIKTSLEKREVYSDNVVPPSPLLNRNSSKSAECNLMKLSHILHHIMPLCTYFDTCGLKNGDHVYNRFNFNCCCWPSSVIIHWVVSELFKEKLTKDGRRRRRHRMLSDDKSHATF